MAYSAEGTNTDHDYLDEPGEKRAGHDGSPEGEQGAAAPVTARDAVAAFPVGETGDPSSVDDQDEPYSGAGRADIPATPTVGVNFGTPEVAPDAAPAAPASTSAAEDAQNLRRLGMAVSNALVGTNKAKWQVCQAVALYYARFEVDPDGVRTALQAENVRMPKADSDRPAWLRAMFRLARNVTGKPPAKGTAERQNWDNCVCETSEGALVIDRILRAGITPSQVAEHLEHNGGIDAIKEAASTEKRGNRAVVAAETAGPNAAARSAAIVQDLADRSSLAFAWDEIRFPGGSDPFGGLFVRQDDGGVKLLGIIEDRATVKAMIDKTRSIAEFVTAAADEEQGESEVENESEGEGEGEGKDKRFPSAPVTS